MRIKTPRILRMSWILFAIAFLNVSEAQSQTSSTLTVHEFAEKIKTNPRAPIVDIRTPEEFEQGHIPNAMNIDWYADSFSQQVASLDKTSPILLYCRSANRSAQAMKQLLSDGFTQVFELKGGILSWIEEELPQSGH